MSTRDINVSMCLTDPIKVKNLNHSEMTYQTHHHCACHLQVNFFICSVFLPYNFPTARSYQILPLPPSFIHLVFNAHFLTCSSSPYQPLSIYTCSFTYSQMVYSYLIVGLMAVAEGVNALIYQSDGQLFNPTLCSHHVEVPKIPYTKLLL